MKILVVHNFYRQPGGEDRVVESEADLLRSVGHDVKIYSVNSADYRSSKLRLAGRIIWSQSDFINIGKEITVFEPDIVHVHNIFPLISVSAIISASRMGIPLIQTLHNYRPFCINGTLYRNGHICTDCLIGSSLSGIVHACYHDSLIESVGAVLSGKIQRAIGWEKKVDLFISSSEFSKEINIQSGIPKDKIIVKPNPSFVESDYKPREAPAKPCFLFIGRLDKRKGILTIMEAAKQVEYDIRILGDGDLMSDMENTIREYNMKNVHLLGWSSKEIVASEMREATATIVSSEFFESFGNVIVESFANGTPVITSNVGAQCRLVDDGYTGLHFEMADATDLARKMRMMASEESAWVDMSKNARNEYNERFSQQGNVDQLVKIYSQAIEIRKQRNDT